MENQTSALALVLDKPVEEVVKDIVLSWNNTSLMESVAARLKAYEGIVYDESSIAQAKQDRSELNKFCKALDDERKRIGKIYDAPLVAFKKQVDEVLDVVASTTKQIDDQLKAFEDERREKKGAEVRAYWDSVVAEFAELIPYERVHSEKWLNASMSMKQVKEEIDKKIEQARNAFTAIRALKSPDENTLKAYYCRTLDLGAALTENERLKDERARIAAIKEQTETVRPTQNAEIDAQTDETSAPVYYTVKFAVTGTRAQLMALKTFMKDMDIVFSPIKEGK